MKEENGVWVVRLLLRYFCNFGGCSIGNSQEKTGPGGKKIDQKVLPGLYQVWRRAREYHSKRQQNEGQEVLE